jgi:CzcA family heavy metal efflux pump
MIDRPEERVAAGEAVESEHWTGRHAKPIIFVVVTLVLVGIYLAFSLPIGVFPHTDFPRIVVGADNGVMPINQMEVVVTRPLEDALRSVQGLRTVRSITSRGSAEIDLFFDWNVNMYLTLELVNAALARAQQSLPPTTKLVANRLTFAAFPIIGYSMTSDTVPQTRLWELATYDVKPRLNRQKGVATVVVQGGQVPEFSVEPDPARLVRTNITISDLLNAIGQSNMIDSPGLLEQNHQLVLGLVSGQVKTSEGLSQIVVKDTPAGLPVRIGDVAQVKPSVMPVYTIVTANGKPAVLLNINRQFNGNTVEVAREVRGEIERIKRDLPRGVKIEPFYDQSELVEASIKSVRDAILIGLVLASLILVLFLRDWGTSLVAGLVIPATIALTLIALKVFGEGFNLMTLGGLAAAVGLVIDDAIVVVENIVMHRDAGQGRAEAIRSAIHELSVPLVGSTVTPIVVFLPLISITGVTGVFFRALAITVAMALLTSLGLALTWTPTLSHFFIKQRLGRKHEEKPRGGAMGLVVKVYERLLRTALRFRWATGLACLGLVGASYLCYRALDSGLIPEMDEGGFILDYISPAGTSLEDTNKMILQVERILKETPEVESTSRRTGLQLGLAQVTEANTGDISVKLKAQRERSSEEVIAEVRKKVNEQLPMLDIEFSQLTQDMIGDLTNAPEPVVIKLFHPDLNLLHEWAPRVGEAIKKEPGIVDVLNGVENTISGPALLYQVDPVVAGRAGFTPFEIEVDASAMLQGEPAPTPVVLGDRPFGVRVRFPAEVRRSLETINSTLIESSTGHTATLGSLAHYQIEPGQTEVIREDLQQVAMVTARFEGINLGRGIAEVKKALAEIGLPPAIRVEFGGGYEEQQKAFGDLIVVLLLAVVLVFTVLLFEFGSFAAPVAILSSALLSTSGVFLALLVTATTFNISSFMGLIMVIGIVAKNGILLLDADGKFRREGFSPREAMVMAGERRLRPILMTALATVAGMAPLALGWGAGSQMLQPLAIAVIGGVTASMLLSLIVTPAVHFMLGAGSRE